MPINYLWTSKTPGPTASAQEHLLKYCWNAPGNWMVWDTTLRRWTPTQNIPGAWNDAAHVGSGYDPYRGNSLSSFTELPGWTAAKNPLLYGGYSGGVGAGTWTLGATGTQGTTWTSLISRFYHLVGVTKASGSSLSYEMKVTPTTDAYKQLQDIYKYPFPYLGGGLTGDILNWCAARDGLTAADYISAYTAMGGRNPADGLRLKVLDTTVIHDQRIPQATAGGTLINPFVANIKFVEAYTQGGTTSNPLGTITSTLGIWTFNGSGVKITGGVWKAAQINCTMDPSISSVLDLFYEQGERCHFNRTLRPSDMIDQKVVLEDVQIYDCKTTNAQTTIFRRGEIAKITLHPWGYAIGPAYTPFQAPGNIGVYDPVTWASYESRPVVLANGWDYPKVAYAVLGLTGSAIESIPQDYCGHITTNPKTLYGTSEPMQTTRDNGTSGIATFPNYMPTVKNAAYTSEFLMNQRMNIVLGDIENPGATALSRMPDPTFVDINNTDTSQTTSFAQYLPWNLQLLAPSSTNYVGTNGIMYLRGRGGYVSIHSEILPTSRIKIGQLELRKGTVVDLRFPTSASPDILFGGIQNSVAVGGIQFKDNWGNSVVGGEGYRYWNTDVSYNRNARQSDSASTPEISAFTPTNSST